MGFWAAAAPALIAAGGSIAGGLLSRGKVEKPDNPPDYDWVKKHGPEVWDYLKGRGYDLDQNPYGLGESRAAMERIGRNTSSAGYSSAQRNVDRNTAISGLSAAGGQSARQAYAAGRGYAEDLNKSLSQIEIADFQAKEDQRQRGMNLLFSLTNKSPVYSQIVSQNYWNALNSENAGNMAMWDSMGGMAGGMYGAYMQNQWMNQNPYPQGGFGYESPYGQGQGMNTSPSGFDPWHAGPQAQDQMRYT